MATTKKLMGTTAVGGGALAIEDVFSTYLFEGTGTTNPITNGIDLAGEGGLVWLKNREGVDSHGLFDTERGVRQLLRSNTTDADVLLSSGSGLTSFNSDGFTLGNGVIGINTSGISDVSWTFRKAPRFFDVVTYTGDGTVRQIPHNLGVVPGTIIVKRTDGTNNWYVQHRSTGPTQSLFLDATSAATTRPEWGNTAPTDSVFTVDGTTVTATNYNGFQYVAYLFAHDPLGPSGDGSDGLIACGSYTGNGSSDGPEVDLGWEPQWVLIKRTNFSDNWVIVDNMRGIVSGGDDRFLFPNLSDAEGSDGGMNLTATGFKIADRSDIMNAASAPYIYIAIRRGPMRQPESGTEVFDVKSSTGGGGTVLTTGFPVDFQIATWDDNSVGGIDREVYTRLLGVSTSSSIGETWLATNRTIAEVTVAPASTRHTQDWDNTGFDYPAWYAGFSTAFWSWRRAPGFFDVVAYTGDGVAGRTVSHNLGVAPEMIICKCRNAAGSWWTYHASVGNGAALRINSTATPTVSVAFWNSTAPADTVFSLGNQGDVNGSGENNIAYLFATLPGISKVGSYTGNGTSQTIDCGFTSGARFILIKRTDSTGDWYIWDTARGIVAANDPHLSLNTNAAEVTTDDSIDPNNSGFIVNQVSATNINVSSASYIFYAIA